MRVNSIFIEQEQMSKLTFELQHQRRIKNNLQTVESEKTEQIKQNHLRLKSKMQGYDKKRQEKHEQKTKLYKLNQQKWTKKIEHIQKKFRHQNRQAIQKAQKYRQQSQDYFKNKQTQITSARGTSYQQFNMNRTQKNLIKNEHQSFINRSSYHGPISTSRNNKYLSLKVATLAEDPSALLHPQSSRGQMNNSRTIDIDGRIVKHKEKSLQLQKQKQMIVFQNAMKTLAKIQLTRKKGQKLKQSSISPVQIRKAKKQNVDSQEQDFYRGSSNHHKKSNTLQGNKSKQSLLNDSIQSHIIAKRKLQQKQFIERQKLMENDQKRTRQSKILKLIKNKIKDLKNSTIKMQAIDQ